MMTWTLKGTSAVCLLLTAFIIGNWLTMLDQGEASHLIGAIITSIARGAVILAVVGAVLSLFRPGWAYHIALFCLGISIYVALFMTFPALWCTFMYCRNWDPPFPIEPGGLLLLLPALAPVLCLRRLARP